MDPRTLPTTITERIVARNSLADLYTEDAIFDANVPDWRFQVKGAAEIAAKFVEPGWWPDGASGVVERVNASGSAVVFELCSTFQRNGGTWLSRNAHILELDEAGRITRHTMYCTGDWSPETITRQAVEAPMVE